MVPLLLASWKNTTAASTCLCCNAVFILRTLPENAYDYIKYVICEIGLIEASFIRGTIDGLT